MTAALAQLGRAFPPELARFGQTLRVSDPGGVTLPDLLRPARLAQVLTRYAAGFPGSDPRAVLSLWSQYYLLTLVPAAVAAALVAGRELPVALDGMAATLSESGQPTSLCLPHAGCAAGQACPLLRLTPLLRTHLRPLADRLAQAGLPARVLWGNAGSVLAWTLGVVAARPDQVETVRHALAEECWVDGGANPFRAVLARHGACGLSRRVCCLRYRLPGLPDCPDCPRRP